MVIKMSERNWVWVKIIDTRRTIPKHISSVAITEILLKETALPHEGYEISIIV